MRNPDLIQFIAWNLLCLLCLAGGLFSDKIAKIIIKGTENETE